MQHPVIDELTYRNYARNRDLGITPERYARVIAIDQEAFERRYQQERERKPFEYKPTENVCPLCGAKHFGAFAMCSRCERSR